MSGYYLNSLVEDMWSVFSKYVFGEWNLKDAACELANLFDAAEIEGTSAAAFVKEYLDWDDSKEKWVIKGGEVIRVVIEDYPPTIADSEIELEGKSAYVIRNTFKETNDFGFLIGKIVFINDKKYTIVGVGMFDPTLIVKIGERLTIVCLLEEDEDATNNNGTE